MLGGVILFALVYYVFHGRHHYDGPVVDIVGIEFSEAVPDSEKV